jgi:hypothetical protein
MQILLLHLTDIHVQGTQDAVLRRAEQIKLASHSAAPNATGCVIVLSGDIAYAGLVTQYEAAHSFLITLREHLLALPSIRTVNFVAVPGNHDCDFTAESDIRQFLLKDVNALYESAVTPASDRVKAILDVQRNFFAFEAKLTDGKEVSPDERLNYARIMKFGNYSIAFQCFNTAWLSRKHEEQGKLFFPTEAVVPVRIEANVCVSVFHHPYNWLDANNYRALKDEVEQSSDLVLTGHEHKEGGGSVERFSGEHLHYLEGAALQGEDGPVDSGFQCLVMDFETGEQRLDQFRWNASHYVSKDSKSWGQIVKNPARERHLFKLNANEMNKMTDPGAAFNHKKKRNLRLSDIYVYPDLREKSVERFVKEDRKPRTINSRDVLGHLRSTPRILITGPDDSGKTALLKTLFIELGFDFVPLLLSGKDLSGKISEGRFRSVISEAVQRQYDAESMERYFQLDPQKRLLLIDDYHQANLQRTSEARLIQLAKNMFGHIVLSAADFYFIRSITRKDLEENPIQDFDVLEIREFGHRLRGRLIGKWLSLGRDAASDLPAIEYETRTTEKIITTLLGKNLVPSYPVNALSLLHTMQSAEAHATVDASFGSLYETLIKANLRFSSGGGAEDAELKFTYTSVLAHEMFDKEKESLTEGEMRKVHEEFSKKFAFSTNFQQILGDLLQANVLTKEMDAYSFKYKHVYYYCVARYFERALKRKDARTAALRKKVEYMADRLHSEEIANIILFYLYLTHDWELTQRILANADKIYGDKEACDLETHVKFVNKIYKEPPKLIIEDNDVESHRDKYREQLDRADEDEPVVPSLNAKLTYQDDLADIYKINIAFKTMQVLGQVLRSSVASMEADVKAQILKSVYMLGLRTMRALLGIAEQNANEFRSYLFSLIKERAAVSEKHLSESELLKITDEGFIWMTFACAYGSIKKVSFAVGHHHLADSFEQILEELGSSTAVGLVDLAIKLDHFATVPTKEITLLRDKVVGNLFAYTLLRQFVADFLYLYRTDARTSQRLGELFKIQGALGPSYLLPDSKKA